MRDFKFLVHRLVMLLQFLPQFLFPFFKDLEQVLFHQRLMLELSFLKFLECGEKTLSSMSNTAIITRMRIAAPQ